MHEKRGGAIATSPNNLLLASAAADGFVVLREVGALRNLQRLRLHDPFSGGATDVAFSHDSRFLFSCGGDGVVFSFYLSYEEEWEAAAAAAADSASLSSSTIVRDPSTAYVPEPALADLPDEFEPGEVDGAVFGGGGGGGSSGSGEAVAAIEVRAPDVDRDGDSPTLPPEALEPTVLETEAAAAAAEQEALTLETQASVRSDLDRLRTRVLALMDENDTREEEERLAPPEFVIDAVDWQRRQVRVCV